MTVFVDEKCIRAGARLEGGKCPVAVALHRATGNAWTVGNTSAWPVEGDYFELYFPDEVVARIGAFDATGAMTPFRFEIDLKRVFHDYWKYVDLADLPAEKVSRPPATRR